MMSMQIFAAGWMTEIYPAIFASPAIFRSIPLTGFAKANAVSVEWRSVIGVQWQGPYLISEICGKIFFKSKSIIYAPIVSMIFVSFIP